MNVRATGDDISYQADSALNGARKPPTLAIGPILWGIDPGHDTRHWYFIVCGIGAKGDVRIDQFKIGRNEQSLARRARDALFLELIHRRPIVISDFDNELAMAHWCEAMDPGERTTRLREAVEREQAKP